MSRVFLVLALGLALAGPPLQWAAGLFGAAVASSSDTDHGSRWDPNGQPGAEAVAGSDSETDHGSQWDPNG